MSLCMLMFSLLTILPKQISQLWNLQTLVVETKSRSIEMKENIWKMYRLRHLNTKAAIVLDKEWDGEAGENLQTLSRLSPESCTVNMSKRARNLKTLGIRGKLATQLNTMALQELSRLEKLKLMNDIQYESASEDRLVLLPQPSNFPPNLKRLTLSNTSLDWKNMSTLAKIDTLEVLKLKNNAFTGISWNADGDVFHSLQFLLIVNADLVLWEASTNNLPSLRSLVLKNCEKLQQIPGGLGKNLEIWTLNVFANQQSSLRGKLSQKRRCKKNKKSKWGVRFKLHIGPGCEQQKYHCNSKDFAVINFSITAVEAMKYYYYHSMILKLEAFDRQKRKVVYQGGDEMGRSAIIVHGIDACIRLSTLNFDMIYARAQARKTRENGSEFEQEKMCLELPKFCFDIAGKVGSLDFALSRLN
ncbi:hypothetical protein ACS0TY_004707 [Phlomoides rotata]